jgi:hypothetical protein
VQRNPRGTPRDRRVWTGGAQGVGAEFFVPGDVDRLLAEGQRCSVTINSVVEVDGLVDFKGRELFGLQLFVTPMQGGGAYRADVALYVPPESEEIFEIAGLPGRVSATNRYCVVIDWETAMARFLDEGDVGDESDAGAEDAPGT